MKLFVTSQLMLHDFGTLGVMKLFATSQLMLRDFGNLGVMKLDPAPPIKELALMGKLKCLICYKRLKEKYPKVLL